MAYEFRARRRVEFAETDMAGLVHFANFFRMMEATEHAFYRSLGLRIHTPNESGTGWPRVSATCEYIAPLRFEDEIEVHLVVREKRSRSIRYAFVIKRLTGGQAQVAARGEMTAVHVARDPRTNEMKAAALPPDFAAAIDTAPPEAQPRTR